MFGELFKFGKDKPLVAFTAGSYSKCVIFIPGLTEGLLALPFLESLQAMLDGMGWALCQPVLTCAYNGYGCSSLDQDAAELLQLLQYLHEKLNQVILIGHSTGCQIICRYFQKYGVQSALQVPRITAAVLQGAVSDREYFSTLPHTAEDIELARSLLVQGKGHALMPRRTDDDVPITAWRFLALADVGGDDDMFSSDLSSDALHAILGPLNVPVLLVLSGSDEYVPAEIDSRALMARMQQAIPTCTAVMIDGARHSLAGHESQYTTLVADFITSLP